MPKQIIIPFIFLLSFACQAQKPVHVKGTYQLRVENNMTQDQAREKAEDLAIVNAIENEFGTYVAQETDINVNNGSVSYNVIGSTKVRGEWLRTTDIKFDYNILESENDKNKEKITWITCKIEGDAREIKPKANLVASTLRCPLLECETVTFKDSQSFFLYFKSPVDGYLSVFIDEGDEISRRLFPYLNQGNESAVKIFGDKPYILFTNAKDLNKFGIRADEIELFTYRSIEYNNIYVVFSPLSYPKPMLDDAALLPDGYMLPKAISTKKFLDWIYDCKVSMPDFQSKRIKISIAKDK